MAHQQAVAFSMPAAQQEKDSWCTTSPCLGVLGQKDYLPTKDFQGAQDYQVMQHEEMVLLAMALQRCVICLWIPQGVLCGTVQGLHRCFTPTWEGRSTRSLTCRMWQERIPWLLHLQKGPHHWDHEQKNQLVCLHLVSQLLQSQEGCTTRQIHPCAEKKTTSTLWAYPFMGGWVQSTLLTGGALAHEYNPGSLSGFCLSGVPAGDHISLPSDGQGTIWIPVPDHCPDIPKLTLPKPLD